MATSAEIAQMMASQNSMFMGQNQYAQQIGVGAQNLGAWGGGAMNTRGAFSYGPSSGGFGGGNRFAGGAMSALGGVASIGAGMAFDPVGAFLGGAAGGMARGGIGAAIGGGMAAAAMPMAVGYAASQGIGAVIRGGQQQSMINTTLGQSFNQFNPMSRSGAGFSRDDAKAIGDSVRSLAHIPEMMTSVEELTRLMPKLKSSGVMQGVKNASEFQSRFREAVGTIRDMSKILGSTMEEAEQFFAHSRSVGFVGRTAQLKNTLNAQLTAGLTGMNTGQVAQLQSSGADMAMQFGARRSLGVNAVTNIAQKIGMAQREGRMQDGMIEDVTGMSGAEGVQAASQRLGGLMMRMSQSAPGKAIMAGAVKFDGRGRAVGLDDDIIKKLNSGEMSLDELKSRGSSMTNAQKISFTARQGDLGADFAGKVDMGKFMQGLVGNKGGDAANLVLQRLSGGSAQDMDLLQSMRGGGSDAQMQEMGKQRAQEASFRDKTDPGAILRRVKTRLHSTMFGGLESAGAKIQTEISKAYDGFIDDLVGRHVISLSKEGSDKLARAMSGGSKKELLELFGTTHGTTGSGGGGMMSSELAAFVTRGANDTGRTIQGKLARSKELIGGMNDVSTGFAARALNRGLGGAGAGASLDVENASLGIEGYRGMDDDRKLDELKAALGSKVSGGISRAGFGGGVSVESVRAGVDALMSGDSEKAAKMFASAGGGIRGVDDVLRQLESSKDPQSQAAARIIRSGQAAQKAGAVNGYVGAIAGGQGKFSGGDRQIDFTKAAGSYGASQSFENVKYAQQQMKDAISGMEKAGLSTQTVALVTSNPGARKVLSKRNDPDVKRALSLRSPEAVAEALNKLGYDVKATDVESLKDARDNMNAGNAMGKSVEGAISTFEKAQAAGDVTAIRDAFTSKAGDLASTIEQFKGSKEDRDTLQKVQSSMEAIGAGGNDITAVQSSITELAKKAASIKDPKARAALLRAAGTIGDAVGETLSGASKLKGKVTQEMLMDKFGLQGDEAKAALARIGVQAGVGGEIGKGVNAEELQSTVAGLKASALATAGRATRAGATEDDPLTQLLKKMDKNADTTNTVLVAIGNKLGADMSGITVTKAQDATNETGKAPK